MDRIPLLFGLAWEARIAQRRDPVLIELDYDYRVHYFLLKVICLASFPLESGKGSNRLYPN
jgi:hypothetical protein